MERKTLVIWLFDQSESLKYQRKEIRESFVKVYEDLDNTFGFTKKNLKDKDAVLLTHMYEYGNGLKKLMFKPTRVTKKILNAFDKIQIDDTGVERTFSAVIETVSRNLRFRKPETKGKDEGQYRNIIVVVVTDEVGDDVSRLEASIGLCRKWKIPVYVLGVPAPFGRQTTPFQWVDPDPRFDQTPHWVEVKQGPESLMVERLDFGYFRHFLENEELIDSGFGPFALSRLAVQTGGAYYSVHPNREVKKDNRNSRYTSRMSQFFDSEIMREYQPEYTNFITFQRKVSLNRCRAALLAAAKIRSPRTDYQPRMDFLRTRNQSPESLVKFPLKQVSNRIVQLRAMYKALSVGEADRQNESVKRWQAGYDLAMGRLLTETVRVERYQFVLEWMKKQKGFQNPKNNTWVIETDKDFQPEGRWKQMADKGRAYLERVVKEHPGTPWAYVASNELKQPIGWICRERFTYIAPPRPQAPTASPPPRRDPPKF